MNGPDFLRTPTPLPPGAPDGFLAGGRVLPDFVSREKPGLRVVVAGAVGGISPVLGSGDANGVAGAAIAPGTTFRQGGVMGQPFPVGRLVVVIPSVPLGIGSGAVHVDLGATGTPDQAGRVGGQVEPFDFLGAPPFLLGKLKDDGDGLAGNARFPISQPALLGGDKAAERAAFPPIDRVIPLVAVFAGRPGFGLGKGVGLVNAAVKGLAPVLRQGFQDGGIAVGVGKGLPVGAVPGDGPGLQRGCPPPPLNLLPCPCGK